MEQEGNVRKFKYGSFGSGEVFRARMLCHLTFSHDWEFRDGYGFLQRCRKCGLYRGVKRRYKR